MFPRFFLFFFLLLLYTSVLAQEKFTVTKDLRSEWMRFGDGAYQQVGSNSFRGLNTIYLSVDRRTLKGNILRLRSDKRYYVFADGIVVGEFKGEARLSIDSLLGEHHRAACLLAIHQECINERDLVTEIVSPSVPASHVQAEATVRPYWHFRDFVVIAGLIIILFFLIALRLNPKLTADYFSIPRLLSSRESDDSQAAARLTSSANVQFYVLCSLLIGFYLLIVFYNLPPRFALPLRFQASGFWMIWWQWLKLSGIIFLILLLKIFLVFSLTRLFGMWGMARYHFFNWIRLLLLVFGAATTVLFIYFIGRGSRPEFFIMFLSFVVVALIGWIVVAFFKLSGRSGHSMFHLFSYLCGTEIIPMLITVKVLFQ